MTNPTAATSPAPTPLAPPGLKGVVVAETAVGTVRGDLGFYHYRNFVATDLAQYRRLEATWHLLLNGTLPTATEEAEFTAEVGRQRVLDADLVDLVVSISRRATTPHAALQSVLPLVLQGVRHSLDTSQDEQHRQVMALAAVTPTILATWWRTRNGLDPIPADPTLHHAADWLRMMNGTMPTDDEVRAIETYLTATIDHGFNASTFAARAVVSTGADIPGALVAATASLSGPLHGGAPSRAFDMIDAIGDPANTVAWVQEQLATGGKIMGFGHAVYKVTDPRSELLKEVALEIGGDLIERAVAIEPQILAELRAHRPQATIVTNVEYFASVVLDMAGVDPEMFTPCFTVSRIIGWGAHLLEQTANNKIIRPNARYIGDDPRALTEAERHG